VDRVHWLAFVRNGDDWGYPACYGQDAAICADVPDPVATLDVHAGAGGVAIVTDELGDGADASALVAEWQLNAVLQVALTQTDGTYTGKPSLFLTGIKNPLPIIALPGGGVLVGSWSTGRIYRVAQE
jgi:glucose/arabinose dehydrogenase